MSTTSLTAGDVMDRVAALMNDPAKTDYTYLAQVMYLNMAIDELCEELENSNATATNQTSLVIKVGVGENQIPSPPADLVEIQSVGERLAGTLDGFIKMDRREFVPEFPPNNALIYWAWENQKIKFNPRGALTAREIQIQYVRQPILQAQDEKSIIGAINARSYLTFKTAALCAMFIGEDENRAKVLDEQADRALDRVEGINNKGRQQMMTRRRPFRSAFKKGGY